MIIASFKLGVVALLAACVRANVAGQHRFARDDSDPFQSSPPVFPSPEMTGSGEWQESFQRAKVMVGKMTLEEKVTLTGGIDVESGCSGTIAAIPRLNFPGMCLSDAGNSVRATDAVSGFASGISVGASWNKALSFQRGSAMGGEARRKGVNVLLGPVVGPAWTIVKGGRNWEASSADPYLSGALSAEAIRGIQQEHVITSTKHYIANEQENNRGPENETEALSSNVDDKTMHEVYLWPFQDAVRAGSANIMCSYQRLNNTYSCGNSKTLNGLLKTELGFQGFVVTDWGALHGANYLLAGLDMTMPNAKGFWNELLVEAVQNGTVPESRVTDMATRIISSWYLLKQDQAFPHPGIGMPSEKVLPKPHDVVEGRDPASAPAILQGATEGHVLVKNEKQTLPLQNPKTISIFGYSATSPAHMTPETEQDGAYRYGLAPVLGMDPGKTPIGLQGTMYGAGGSGAVTPETYTSPHDALIERAAKGDFTLLKDLNNSNPIVDPSSDACIIFGNAWAREGNDRPALQDDYTDSLINGVADQCAKTIVVLHNAGVRLVEGFVSHPNVTALVFAHLPGQDSGNAINSLLFGDTTFTGKLPYTVAKKESDYGDLLNPVPPSDPISPQAYFPDGIYLDYKYFEKSHIQPLYEFGFGLSYNRWDYSNIQLQGPLGNTAEWPTGQIISGGQADLWDVITSVTFTLRNSGKYAGGEAAQLYVRIPGLRAKQLRGFEKPTVQPGQTVQVTYQLTRRDLSVWDTVAQKWHLQSGKYEIYIGRSSAKLPLKTYLTI